MKPVIAALTFACIVSAQQPETMVIEFLAVDENGKPVPNLRISSTWSLNRSGTTFASEPNTTTNAEGKARITASNEPRSWYAYDEALTVGAVASQPKGSSTIKMLVKPLATLRTNVVIEGWEGTPPRGSWVVDLLDSPYGQVHAMFPFVTELKLPAGAYNVSLLSTDMKDVTATVQLKAGEASTLELKPVLTKIARNYGKPAPPIQVTDQRNLDKPFNLEDYRGKWVFIEFWSYT